MAKIDITLNGRNYAVACDEGQEQRLIELAGYLDGRLRAVSRAAGAASDAHLLAVTALLMADEIFDLRDAVQQAQMQVVPNSGELAARAEQLRQEQAKLEQERMAFEAAQKHEQEIRAETEVVLQKSSEEEAALAEMIEQLAGRIEGMASKLENGSKTDA